MKPFLKKDPNLNVNVNRICDILSEMLNSKKLRELFCDELIEKYSIVNKNSLFY
jgi:hypothetical protein